jgi:diguanylate cyclase (GGDEF)-like protein
LATTDWLTGLRNRRSFETIAELEIARQKRYGGVFSLALVDLDDFKGLNDARGHHAGDETLKLLAAVLQKHTRASDSIARLGGDEFVVLMPSTQKADCSLLCQQISRKIADRMAAVGFATTASIGCATFEQAPTSVSEALQRADEAMYFAKANGKMRTSERTRMVGGK